jgi:transcriptional regulator with XRE-family HTH domain
LSVQNKSLILSRLRIIKMSKVVTSFGEYIRSLRETAGLPIRKIAAQLDIDPSLLGKIERNERQPTREQIASIAKILQARRKIFNGTVFKRPVRLQNHGRRFRYFNIESGRRQSEILYTKKKVTQNY